jgi:hypothetical protein
VTDKEIVADLQADLLIARKTVLKALAKDNAQEYFDAREKIQEIETMIKLAR